MVTISMTKKNSSEVLISERPDSPEEWNNAVSEFKEGTFFQSTFLGDYLSYYKNCSTYYLKIKNGSSVIGLCLAWKEKIAFRSFRVFPRIFCYYGPLLKTYNKENIEIFLVAIDKICKSERIMSLEKLTPPIHFNSASYKENIENILFSSFDGYKYKDWATIFVDIGKTQEDLWSGITYSAKKCIRRNLEDNIEVVM